MCVPNRSSAIIQTKTGRDGSHVARCPGWSLTPTKHASLLSHPTDFTMKPSRPQMLVIDEVGYLSYAYLRRMRLTSTRIALVLPAHVRDRDAPVRPHAARIMVSTAMGS